MRLSIKAILVGVLLALCMAIAGQGVLAVTRLQAINANAIDVAGNWLPSVRWLGDIKYRVTRLRLVDARYVTGLEPAPELDKTSAGRLQDLANGMAQYEPLIASPEEKALWDGFKEKWAAYMAVRAKLASPAAAGDKLGAAQAFDASRPIFNAALDLIEQDTALNLRGSDKAVADAAKTYRSSL
ncbi:MCP four helix bundle domain-containing protein [Methylobacterium iners]|uniref:Chemotaxis methyl-accepting receptor HlyB-like 4HB MCP domain-containing protein n=1 Tax=Methylobacterium iners TaxID=418707 RepID=A0ABQ4RUE5_9HYPH|nr:MCP four helix bundle domain-containing protein [Methylobacterium iners]GJD93793.1 hypothetical protein OCOJLMKI_0991 [Methylobacterium iners]